MASPIGFLTDLSARPVYKAGAPVLRQRTSFPSKSQPPSEAASQEEAVHQRAHASQCLEALRTTRDTQHGADHGRPQSRTLDHPAGRSSEGARRAQGQELRTQVTHALLRLHSHARQGS